MEVMSSRGWARDHKNRMCAEKMVGPLENALEALISGGSCVS
jgi:hypothetical protein